MGDLIWSRPLVSFIPLLGTEKEHLCCEEQRTEKAATSSLTEKREGGCTLGS